MKKRKPNDFEYDIDELESNNTDEAQTDSAYKTSPRIQITSKLSVDEILHLDKIPKVLAVPRGSAAYVLDYSAITLNCSIESKIRSDSQDCWKSKSAGAKAGDAWIEKGVLHPTRCILARRAVAVCQGVKVCNLFPMKSWEGMQRYEADTQETERLGRAELEANAREGRTMNLATST